MTDPAPDTFPDARGRTAIVTGATGGLGLAAARALARAGARVVLTGRNEAKGARALQTLRQALPDANLSFRLLDIASLGAIADFANDWQDPLDILINNAGVMGARTRQVTPDGFELQFGTNHLGHFALTGRLLSRLEAGRGVVVTVASVAAFRGDLPFDDLHARHRYRPFGSYSRSKLANLMFARELARRAQALSLNIHSRAAHPGWSSSDIIANSARLSPTRGRLGQVLTAVQQGVGEAAFRLLGQSVDDGARPIVHAAIAPGAEDGAYYGPQGNGERRGPPGLAKLPHAALDTDAAARLWDASERMTGVRFADLDGRPDARLPA